ncbi:MAG TPA: hypothetical protein VKA85_10340, partial [Candidatus Limnocylindrales bacterium]|nr:hypothetical protein [Candidatus Limnocylindrales bacterium]
TPRDGIAGIECLDEGAVVRVAERLCAVGLSVVSGAPATPGDLAAVRSSWLRRLSADPTRAVWRIELARGSRDSRESG